MPLTRGQVVAIAQHVPEKDLRKKILGSLPTIRRFVRVQADDYAGPNKSSLLTLTRQFHALGFKHVADVSIVNKGQTMGQGFSRVLVHPKLGCYAEAIATDEMIWAGAQLLCGVMSYLTGGWSVGVGNKQPSEGDYLIRLPKAVRVAIPGKAPRALLAQHLAYRERMIKALKLGVLKDATGKLHFRKMKLAQAQIRKKLARTSLSMELVTPPVWRKNGNGLAISPKLRIGHVIGETARRWPFPGVWPR